MPELMLVPREPTDEMVEAALLRRHGTTTFAALKAEHAGRWAIRMQKMRECLAAALAAYDTSPST